MTASSMGQEVVERLKKDAADLRAAATFLLEHNP